jgi:hypothetical protein
MKVDFIIVGAQKCGTTTLYDILNTHPLLVGSSKKEPNFFSENANWRESISAYEALFTPQYNALYFEASTSYTFYPVLNLNIWDDIYQYNPNMKFIYILRNPIDRVVSSYMHTFERGYTDKSIEDAICQDMFLTTTSRYYTQIKPYITRFGRDRVLILDFDDLSNDIRKVAHVMADFLEVDHDQFPAIDDIRSNVSLSGKKRHHKFEKPALHLKLLKTLAPKLWEMLLDNSSRTFERKPVLEKEYREVIVRMVMSDIKPLEELMGKDLSSWYDGVQEYSIQA